MPLPKEYDILSCHYVLKMPKNMRPHYGIHMYLHVAICSKHSLHMPHIILPYIADAKNKHRISLQSPVSIDPFVYFTWPICSICVVTCSLYTEDGSIALTTVKPSLVAAIP